MKNLKQISIACGALVALMGCNAGMSPEPMSNQDAKSALASASPQDQIKYYAGSPMDPAEKQKKIAEIEQKYGIKASDVLGGAGMTGAPGSLPAAAGNAGKTDNQATH